MLSKVYFLMAFVMVNAACASNGQECGEITGPPEVPPAEATHHARVVGRVVNLGGDGVPGIHVKANGAPSATACRRIDVLEGFAVTAANGSYVLDLRTVAPASSDDRGDIWLVAVQVDEAGTTVLDSTYATIQVSRIASEVPVTEAPEIVLQP